MYDAIFFDLDGTLIDTERLFLESSRCVLNELGVTEGVDAFLHSTLGVDTPRTIRMFEQTFPQLDINFVRSQIEQRFAGCLAREVPMKTGAFDLLRGLKGQFPMGLVTSSFHDPAHKKLKLSQIDYAFDVVVVREDVTAAKPSPEPYLLAASKLGVNPTRCLVFEDSEPGVAAAHAAGMKVVQVPDILPAQGNLAHFIADDLWSGATWAGLQVPVV